MMGSNSNDVTLDQQNSQEEQDERNENESTLKQPPTEEKNGAADLDVIANLSTLSMKNDNKETSAPLEDAKKGGEKNSPQKCIVVKTDNNQSHTQVLSITSSSLNNLLVYSSSSSESDSEENVLNIDDNDSSSCSTSDDDSISDSFDCENDVLEPLNVKPQNVSKTKRYEVQETLTQLREMSLNDLPPVPAATAQVKPEECDQIGKVSSIIDTLVMVESIPNKPAYDIDTLLFLDKGERPLGYIFDVIGPVTNPLYAIRFNSTQDIEAQCISKGMPVYSAPKSQHSHFVFVQQLLKEKGSDASWTGDVEVPKEYADYSDDETEHYVGVNAKTRKRNSLERYKNYEKDMNVRNLVDTKLHKVRDSSEPKTKKPNYAAAAGQGSQQQLMMPNNAHQHSVMMRPKGPPHKNNEHYAAGSNAVVATSTTAAHCAFRPPYTMPPYATTLNPFAAQFIPSAQRLPMPPPPSHIQQALGYHQTAPPQQTTTVPLDLAMYHNISMAPPANATATNFSPSAKCSQQSAAAAATVTSATPTGGVLYPPDMGLPSHLPPSHGPPLVTSLPYYTPVMWGNFSSPPPPPPPQSGPIASSPNATTTTTSNANRSFRKNQWRNHKKRQQN